MRRKWWLFLRTPHRKLPPTWDRTERMSTGTSRAPGKDCQLMKTSMWQNFKGQCITRLQKDSMKTSQCLWNTHPWLASQRCLDGAHKSRYPDPPSKKQQSTSCWVWVVGTKPPLCNQILIPKLQTSQFFAAPRNLENNKPFKQETFQSFRKTDRLDRRWELQTALV